MIPISAIRDLQKSSFKFCIAITGGGAELFGDLLKHGGGSNFFVQGIIPYDTHSFQRFVGGNPDKFCSEEAARNLATTAFKECCKITKNNEKSIGIGATSSLTKYENERENRENKIYVAYQTLTTTYTENLIFPQEGTKYTREEQETITSQIIFKMIRKACNLPIIPNILDKHTLSKVSYGRDDRTKVFSEQINLYSLHINKNPINTKLVFPGSFNPMHDGHKKLAEIAHKLYESPVDFEMSLINVDKPSLDYTSLDSRIGTIFQKKEPYFGKLHLTNAPRFVDKAELFPNSIFIIGYDTYERLCNPKYYDNEVDMINTLTKMRDLFKINFLIFHRNSENIDISKNLLINMNMARIIPASETEEFKNISSKNIRNSTEIT